MASLEVCGLRLSPFEQPPKMSRHSASPEIRVVIQNDFSHLLSWQDLQDSLEDEIVDPDPWFDLSY